MTAAARAAAASARALLEPGARRRLLAVGVAAALLLGAAAMVVARELVLTDPPRSSDPPRSAPRGADELVRFRDTAGGLSISHPAGWRRVASPDPEVRLLVEGDGASMLVRMSDLGVTVGPDGLRDARKLTDKLVRSAGQARQERPPKQVTLGGLPGYLYLYTFPDRASGGRGAHAHYFLFRGRTLITIIFQTVPSERLAGLAPLFDRIGETLRVTTL